MNELSSHNTGAGKGDGDRSPKWRDHYDEIDWGFEHYNQVAEGEGFERVSAGRLRKRYGTGAPAGVSVENMDNGEIDTYESKTQLIARRASQSLFEPPRWLVGIDPAAPGEDRSVPAVPPKSKACCGGSCCEGND
jgi:hypothetical protein